MHSDKERDLSERTFMFFMFGKNVITEPLNPDSFGWI